MQEKCNEGHSCDCEDCEMEEGSFFGMIYQEAEMEVIKEKIKRKIEGDTKYERVAQMVCQAAAEKDEGRRTKMLEEAAKILEG